MAEQRKSKASELREALLKPLTPEQRQARLDSLSPRPKLKLNGEVAQRALGTTANVKDVLAQLEGDDTAKVAALHDADSGASAVVIPVEQYLELVTSRLRDNEVFTFQAEPSGRVGPQETDLAELGVEQVNPRDTWWRTPGYDPTSPGPE